MNRFGSYRALLASSQAAVIAAIDVYNRPAMEYRDEATVILLVNGWELLVKAILSKQRIPIYYPKERGKPYQTLSIWDAFRAAAPSLPAWVPAQALAKNLDVLIDYRNNAVHFYTLPGFGVVVNSLAQTSIENYREVLLDRFDIDIATRTNTILHPFGFGHNLDPVAYLRRAAADRKQSSAVGEVVRRINDALRELECEKVDTSCFMSWYRVKLESVKKIESADLVVAVASEAAGTDGIVVERRFDPNDPNWVRETEIIAAIPALHGIPFTQRVCRALVWKLRTKEKREYCWIAKEGSLTKYSKEVIAVFRRLDKATVDQALQDYRSHLGKRRKPA